MAQTSTRRNSQARRRTTGRSSGSGRSAASSRGSSSTRNRQQRNGSGGAKSRRSGAARSSSRTNARSRRQPRRSGATARADSVKQVASKGKNAVAERAQSGGKAISTVAGKMKGPALASGAALTGLAGGMAMQSRRDSRRKVLGMRLGNGVGKAGKNLVDAGQNVGRFTENLGEFAAEMRKTREAIDNRAKHRSPIEVVLQALTARR
jgi:hypothetical protein